MDEELKRQIEELRMRLHADGVTDFQRSQALDLLKICRYCGDKNGNRCQCWNDE
jgi:hypothetical protein